MGGSKNVTRSTVSRHDLMNGVEFKNKKLVQEDIDHKSERSKKSKKKHKKHKKKKDKKKDRKHKRESYGEHET